MRTHPQFILGTNEAGMFLSDARRGADAAIWRRGDLPEAAEGFCRVPPLLTVEVTGRDEPEASLREKARWYLAVGFR